MAKVTHAQALAAFNAGQFMPVTPALLAGYCIAGDLIWWPEGDEYITVVYRPGLQVFVVGTEADGEYCYTLGGAPASSFFTY